MHVTGVAWPMGVVTPTPPPTDVWPPPPNPKPPMRKLIVGAGATPLLTT